jgi:hypothetical protein
MAHHGSGRPRCLWLFLDGNGLLGIAFFCVWTFNVLTKSSGALGIKKVKLAGKKRKIQQG